MLVLALWRNVMLYVGCQMLIPIQMGQSSPKKAAEANESSVIGANKAAVAVSNKPKRTGSLALFFRKVSAFSLYAYTCLVSCCKWFSHCCSVVALPSSVTWRNCHVLNVNSFEMEWYVIFAHVHFSGYSTCTMHVANGFWAVYVVKNHFWTCSKILSPCKRVKNVKSNLSLCAQHDLKVM